MPEFIFMLTHDDKTVANALEVYDDLRDLPLSYVGFKDVGVPHDTLRELTRRMHADGREVMLEVVSESAEDELRSVAAAADIGVDWVLGGTHPDEAIAALEGADVALLPVPGTRSSAIRACCAGRSRRSRTAPVSSRPGTASTAWTCWRTASTAMSRHSWRPLSRRARVRSSPPGAVTRSNGSGPSVAWVSGDSRSVERCSRAGFRPARPSANKWRWHWPPRMRRLEVSVRRSRGEVDARSMVGRSTWIEEEEPNMTNQRDPRLDLERVTRLAIERRLTRRQFLGASGASMAAAALAACAPTPAGSGTTGSAAPGAGASAAAAGGTMTLATWPNYHSPDVIKAFEDSSGVKVNVTVYGSTEEMEAKLRAGNSGIDVVLPSNYAVEGWVADSLIQAIDYAKLPNFKREDWNARFMDQAFDKGNTHTIPKNWGTTGIAYRSTRVTEDITTWKQFFEVAGTTYSGKTVIVDHQISSIGSAAVGMGYSLNTIDPAEMGNIEAMLSGLKPKLYAISSDVQPPLRNEDSWLTIAWTGDGVQVSRDNADARYVVAEDGGELWIDSYTVANDAPIRPAPTRSSTTSCSPRTPRSRPSSACSRTPTTRPRPCSIRRSRTTRSSTRPRPAWRSSSTR